MAIVARCENLRCLIIPPATTNITANGRWIFLNNSVCSPCEQSILIIYSPLPPPPCPRPPLSGSRTIYLNAPVLGLSFSFRLLLRRYFAAIIPVEGEMNRHKHRIINIQFARTEYPARLINSSVNCRYLLIALISRDYRAIHPRELSVSAAVARFLPFYSISMIRPGLRRELSHASCTPACSVRRNVLL